MKKLCYFINSDWYFDLHWIERAQFAQKEGYQIHIITHFQSEKILSRFKGMGFYCHHINLHASSFSPLNFLSSFIETKKIIKDVSPDLLHCITIKACLIGGVLARLQNIPIVLSFVGLGRVFMDGPIGLKIIKKIVTHIYKYIIANKHCTLLFEHENDRNYLINLLDIDVAKTVVIDGAGINLEKFAYSPEPNVSKPVVLFAGRLLWSKGLGDLVEVKKILAQKDINFDLKVAGICVESDSDAIPLDVIKSWNDAGIIEWLGKSDNVFDLIKSSNIVALPSVYSEGIPRILLEASSVGRVCVTYNAGGCGSIVVNDVTGLVVEKKDIATLVEKFEYLIRNPDIRLTMGLHARARVEEKYSSELILENTLQMYKKAINT